MIAGSHRFCLNCFDFVNTVRKILLCQKVKAPQKVFMFDCEIFSVNFTFTLPMRFYLWIWAVIPFHLDASNYIFTVLQLFMICSNFFPSLFILLWRAPQCLISVIMGKSHCIGQGFCLWRWKSFIMFSPCKRGFIWVWEQLYISNPLAVHDI
jgi:hypothetical protein